MAAADPPTIKQKADFHHHTTVTEDLFIKNVLLLGIHFSWTLLFSEIRDMEFLGKTQT